MNKKTFGQSYFLKLFILVLALTFIFPLQSKASIFDWFSGTDSVSVPGNFSASTGAIYADASPSQIDNNQLKPISLRLDGGSLLAVSSLLSVGNKSQVVIPIRRTMRVIATAYSSTVDQTDNDPFTTANGTRVRDGIIATNILPFNTLVKIPDLYGDKVFTVTDRMNARYSNYIDIWFQDRISAKKFGAKLVNIEIVGSL